jgi:hypothetical protein
MLFVYESGEFLKTKGWKVKGPPILSKKGTMITPGWQVSPNPFCF